MRRFLVVFLYVEKNCRDCVGVVISWQKRKHWLQLFKSCFWIRTNLFRKLSTLELKGFCISISAYVSKLITSNRRQIDWKLTQLFDVELTSDLYQDILSDVDFISTFLKLFFINAWSTFPSEPHRTSCHHFLIKIKVKSTSSDQPEM